MPVKRGVLYSLNYKAIDFLDNYRGYATCATPAKSRGLVKSTLLKLIQSKASLLSSYFILDRLCRLYNFGEPELYYVMMVCDDRIRAPLQAKMFDTNKPPVMGDFEDTQFPLPAFTDEYLRRAYGDYMRLPEVKDRVPHGMLYVDLDTPFSVWLENGGLEKLRDRVASGEIVNDWK